MIDPKYYGLIEMGFTFGIVALVLGYQYWTVRDAGKKPKDGE